MLIKCNEIFVITDIAYIPKFLHSLDKCSNDMGMVWWLYIVAEKDIEKNEFERISGDLSLCLKRVLKRTVTQTEQWTDKEGSERTHEKERRIKSNDECTITNKQANTPTNKHKKVVKVSH